ncbi:SecDF P1 head subdomain-containing protein [Verrucomicrobiota bacterium sgz303538]
MNIKAIAVLLLLATSAVLANASSDFELHSVADAPKGDTKEYTLPPRNGRSETILLDSAVLLDSSALKSVKVVLDGNNKPQLLITFTDSGAKRFGEITKAHIGKRLGILLAGKLHSTPVVNEPIMGGSVEISGNFTEEEATALSDKLSKSIKP